MPPALLVRRARDARFFGVRGYVFAHTHHHFFGRPRRATPLAPRVEPCGLARWVCACLRAKYADDPRHAEYAAVLARAARQGEQLA